MFTVEGSAGRAGLEMSTLRAAQGVADIRDTMTGGGVPTTLQWVGRVMRRGRGRGEDCMVRTILELWGE